MEPGGNKLGDLPHGGAGDRAGGALYRLWHYLSRFCLGVRMQGAALEHSQQVTTRWLQVGETGHGLQESRKPRQVPLPAYATTSPWE